MTDQESKEIMGELHKIKIEMTKMTAKVGFLEECFGRLVKTLVWVGTAAATPLIVGAATVIIKAV